MKVKKILTAVGVAALTASLIPYSVKKDEETGTLTVRALLWSATRRPNPEIGKETVTIRLLENCFPSEREEEDWADDFDDLDESDFDVEVPVGEFPEKPVFPPENEDSPIQPEPETAAEPKADA